MQILVVRTGNICRSSMGEIVLRDHLDHEGLDELTVIVASVETPDEEHEYGLNHYAAQVLREAGYPPPRERFAHRATVVELRESGLILAMTVGHARLLREILETAGEDTRKPHLWREFDGTIPFAPDGVFGEGEVLPAPHGSGKNSTRRLKRRHYSDQYSSDGDYGVSDSWYGGLDEFYDILTAIEAGATGIVKHLRHC